MSDIEFKIDRQEIPLNEFKQLTESFFALIDEVAFEVCEKRNIIEQYISVKKGSVILKSNLKTKHANDNDCVKKTVDAINNGLKLIQTQKQRPPYFNDKVVDLLYRISNSPDVSIQSDSNIIPITKELASNALINMSQPQTYSDISSVEGIVTAIELAGRTKDKKIRLTIKEALRNIDIKCSFINEAIEEQAKYLIGKRVYAYGSVAYNANDIPASINIERLEKIDDDNLPTWREMRGILNGNA